MEERADLFVPEYQPNTWFSPIDSSGSYVVMSGMSGESVFSVETGAELSFVQGNVMQYLWEGGLAITPDGRAFVYQQGNRLMLRLAADGAAVSADMETLLNEGMFRPVFIPKLPTVD